MESHKPAQHAAAFQIQVSTDPIHWLVVTGMMVMVIILILINRSLVVSYRKFRQKNQDHHYTSLTVLCSIITTISFGAAALLVFLTTVFVVISNDFYHHTVIGDILCKLSISFYTLSQTLMIFIFIKRIDTAFGGSAVEYPKIVIKSLYFVSIVFVIFCLSIAVSLAFELMNFFIVLIFIWMTLFLSLSIMLCILFIRKANILLEFTAALSGNNIVDKDVLYVIVKQSILVPFAICTSFTCFSMVLLVQYLRASSEWIPAAVFWIAVDCTVSSVGIFLLFSWNNHIYDKYCNVLHGCCEKNKMHRMEVSRSGSKNSKSNHSKSNVNDAVEPSQPTYTMTHTVKAMSSVTRTVNDKSTVTDTSGTGKQLLSVHAESPEYAMQPIILSPKLTMVESLKRRLSNKNIAGVEDEDMKTKPKLTIVESLKRIVGKDKDKNNDVDDEVSLHLMGAHRVPKLQNNVHSAPVQRYGGYEASKSKHESSRSWQI